MKDLEPDIDPVESQEWQDAIEDVIERDGANRAHFLLDKAVQKARAAGATLPPPDVAHDTAFPCRSVIVMIVLLKVAWTCATPSSMYLRSFSLVRFLFWTFAIQSVSLLICGWVVSALFGFER